MTMDLPVQLSEEKLHAVTKKLDAIQLELLRLRASLLHEEELTAHEKREFSLAMKEYKEGKSIPLARLKRKAR